MSKQERKTHEAQSNNYGSKEWKSKFHKAIEIDQGLKSIMSLMTNEEHTNQVFVSALVASNSQPSVSGNQVLVLVLSAYSIQPSSTVLVVRPPTPNAVATIVVTSNPPIQTTISTVVQAYPETNVKFQSILKK